MTCKECPYTDLCDNGFSGEKLQDCWYYREFVKLQEEWVAEESQWFQNLKKTCHSDNFYDDSFGNEDEYFST